MKNQEIEFAWQGPLECRNCGIRNLVLFADLAEQDFQLIHEPIKKRNYAPGDALYRSGQNTDCVFTIREGEVKLVQIAPGGSQRIVRILHQGDLAGLERLVGSAVQHDAVALTPVAVCELPVNVVERLSRETPRLHTQLMQRWEKAVNVADSWLTDLSTGPARSRVARLLLWLMESSPQESFYLPSREDIGAMLGITTETASRMTAEFRRDGLLRLLENHRATGDEVKLRLAARL
ncbi:MAG: Crp/Fnr family transcriptional regulator [Pseudomonadota bacterium]